MSLTPTSNLSISDPTINFIYRSSERSENAIKALKKVAGARFEVVSESGRSKLKFYHTEREVDAILSKASVSRIFPQRFTPYQHPGRISTMGRETFNKDASTYLVYNEQINKLKDISSEYFKKNSFAGRPQEITSFSKLPALKKVLKKHEGLCIAEHHQESATKEFIIKKIKNLKELGVKTLFLEHMFYDTMQTQLDQCKKDKNLYPYLEEYLDTTDRGFRVEDHEYGFKALVKTALKNGIRVVGMDTSISYVCGVNRALGVEDAKPRLAAMNFVAEEIIKREKGDGKYVVLVGIDHATKTAGIPGMSEILNIPATASDAALEIKKNSI